MPLRLAVAAALVGAASVLAPAAQAQSTARPAVSVSAGSYSPSGFYSDGGALVPRVRSLALGAEVPVVRRPVLTGTLGATLRFASVDGFFSGGGEVSTDGDPSFRSGFRPQHLDLYARVERGGLAATAGFVLDLGPDAYGEPGDENPTDDDRPPFLNSDAQHAVRFGLGARRAAGPVRLSADADAFLTFTRHVTVTGWAGGDAPLDSLVYYDGTYDFGDTYVVQAGAGYPVGPVELGLDVVYALTTPFHEESESPSDLPNTDDGRRLLSLVPRASLTPRGSRVTVEVAGRAPGGWYGEHVPYGITLAGENQPEVRLPLSVGVRVGL